MQKHSPAMNLMQYRQQENQGRRGHASSDDLSQRDFEERLLATMASAITLMETTACIQRETAELLLTLARRNGNESGIQRLRKVEETLRVPAAGPDGELVLFDGSKRPQGGIEGTGQACVFVETLTAREVTVLQLLRGTLTHRQIAQELWVSANTIKTHSRAIYRKLGVSNRRDAIQRARELGIF